MNIYLIYITVGEVNEAVNIGRALVADRLVACVNMINNMQSIYWWDGKIQEETEVILMAKTTGDRVPAVIEKVKKLHSYECPCIVSLPITDGNPAFFDWIKAEVNDD